MISANESSIMPIAFTVRYLLRHIQTNYSCECDDLSILSIFYYFISTENSPILRLVKSKLQQITHKQHTLLNLQNRHRIFRDSRELYQ